MHDDSETVADGFTYTVTDAAGHTASAAVMITVSRVNDNTPVAVGETESVAEGGTLVASVAGNDSDVDVGDTLTYSLATGPAHGTLTLNANGSYSYVHDDSETVADGFTYTVTERRATRPARRW